MLRPCERASLMEGAPPQDSDMIKRRNRAKQTSTLDERLAKFTENLRQQAKTLPGSSQEAAELGRRIRQGEAALRINASLTAKLPDSSA